MKSNFVGMLKSNWPLIGIFSLGLGLRWWGIAFALPYMYDPDESVPVTIALKILHTGNLNPGFFDWPSLSIYFYTLVYGVYFAFGRLAGTLTSPADLRLPDVEIMAVGRTLEPAGVLLCRGATAIVGALSILTIYLIVRQISVRKETAWLAALLLATEFVDVEYSHIIRPETFVVFFALWSLYFSLKILHDPSPRNYVLAAVAAGLAASSKYNAALIFIPLLAAHWVRFGNRWFLQRQIYVAALAAAASFLLTTPFAILDLTNFLKMGPIEVAEHYSSGHPGAEGNTLLWYASFLWATQGLGVLFAISYFISVVYHRDKAGLVLASFPAIYFVFINFYAVHFAATVLPIIPFLLIAAALLVERLYTAVIPRIKTGRSFAVPVLASIVAILVLPPLSASAAYDMRIARPDGRELAREWMSSHLPPGSRIALEAYSPYLDRARFAVTGFYGIPDQSPDWYVSQGFEYLVFSSGIFGRYFDDPTLYASEVNRYNAFFSKFTQVARFSENGFEVRVYRTDVVLPEHRLAARFGDWGDVIEFVGYDGVTPVRPGETLNLTLYWRALRQESPPLELTLSLLGRDGRQLGSVRGDLFQGRGRPSGLFSGQWSISVPADSRPGLYRIELNVTETQFAYRTPIMNSADQRIDQLTLGPIKISPAAPSANEIHAARAANVRFGNEMMLLGYALPDTAGRAGGLWSVTLYWQSLQTAPDYTVFVHLLDGRGNLRAQIDSPPLDGAYPTSAWDKGEIVRDDFVLPLPPDLEPGTFHIEIGIYGQLDTRRLPAVDAGGTALGDHWNLPAPVTITQ